MKKILLLIVVSVFSIDAYTQCENLRLEREVWGTISNNYRANSAFTYGMISYQSHEDNFYYDTPEDSLFYLGYGKGLWVAAKDQAGNLSVSANEFASTLRHDFIPGPIDRNTGRPLDTLCGVYNRVWKVTQVDVFNHQLQFQAGTLELDNIPLDILEWPAKGNPYLEEGFSPDFDLAPFNDVSEDGIYDPLSGDHPIALEENPDFIPYAFSFIVYNDLAFHTNNFGSQGVGMEFYQTNYLVNCSQISEAEQTVFTRIKYKYLGEETLSEFKISLWEDNDLACNQNDYEGCSRELNCTYFYNRNGETFVGECHDPDVPNNNGAVRSTVLLNQELKSFRHYFLLGIGDTLIQGIDPAGAEEHYNYMNNLWRDGTPITVGGNGYDPSSTETTVFAYPDLPNDPQGWSMQTAQLPIPLDVRGLAGVIDETDVAPGTEGVIDLADHFLYDIQRKRLAVFDIWPEAIERLKAEHAMILDGTFDCGGDLEICLEDCVWPGDANRDRGVTGKDFIITGLFAGQDIADGVSRTTTSTDWFGYNADNWNQSLGTLNAKNADANGNGVVNQTDLNHVADNFGQRREGFWDSASLLETTTDFDNQLVLQLETNEVDLATAALFDRIVETDVFLATTNPELTPIHGISFDMRFDTNMVAPFIRLDDDGTSIFQYDFSYLDNPSRDTDNSLIGDNRIQYAFTNHNGINTTSGGRLINQNMLVKEDATTSNLDGTDTLVIKFYNVCAVNAAGEELVMSPVYDTLIISNLRIDSNLITATKQITNEENLDFSIYPNPTSDLINIKMNQPLSGQVKITDLTGQVITTKQLFRQDKYSLDTKALVPGVYLLYLTDEAGRQQVKQFVKI